MKIGYMLKSTKSFVANIVPIIDNSPDKSIKHFIFHINKIYITENEKESDSNVDFIELTNITNLKATLKRYKLDFMLFLSPGHIYELLILNICKELSILTIFYQHGLSLDLSSFDPKSLFQDKSISRRISSIKKLLFFYYSFVLSIFFVKKKYRLIQILFYKNLHFFIFFFRAQQLHKLPKYGLHFIHCDFAFVYGQKDKNYLIETLNMSANNITVSGYPFLMPTDSSKDLSKQDQILYLSSAFREDGIMPITKEQEKCFYLTLLKQVEDAGYALNIKVHPRDDLKIIQNYFINHSNVRIYKNDNLADLTILSRYVISDFSTAIFYAIKYFKPVIILNSEYFKNYPFDYTEYGIGVKTDLHNLCFTLKNYRELSRSQKNSYKNFLTDFLYDNRKVSTFQTLYYQMYRILGKTIN